MINEGSFLIFYQGKPDLLKVGFFMTCGLWLFSSVAEHFCFLLIPGRLKCLLFFKN